MSFRLRPFSFLGCYPTPDIEIGTDILFRSGQTLFSCTKNRKIERYSQSGVDQPAFELDNWTVQEVRFFASLYIGNGEASTIRLYPLPISRDLEVESPDAVLEDGSLLRPLLEATSSDNYFMAGNHGLQAQRLNEYQFWEWNDCRLTQASKFWRHFDQEDAVMIRGLHALLKSEMLFSHFQFRDASLAFAHIALDAAYSMVLRRLREAGFPNPTSAQAQAYLDDLWGVPRTNGKFFEDYYVDRVRNFHTDSRYGAESIPFFSIDDILDLNAALKGVFYLLATGEMHEETRMNRDDFLKHAGLVPCAEDGTPDQLYLQETRAASCPSAGLEAGFVRKADFPSQ